MDATRSRDLWVEFSDNIYRGDRRTGLVDEVHAEDLWTRLKGKICKRISRCNGRIVQVDKTCGRHHWTEFEDGIHGHTWWRRFMATICGNVVCLRLIWKRDSWIGLAHDIQRFEIALSDLWSWFMATICGHDFVNEICEQNSPNGFVVRSYEKHVWLAFTSTICAKDSYKQFVERVQSIICARDSQLVFVHVIRS